MKFSNEHSPFSGNEMGYFRGRNFSLKREGRASQVQRWFGSLDAGRTPGSRGKRSRPDDPAPDKPETELRMF